eukprot:GHVQ01016366.1.p1 GENE.GHVQ01016366.1~~GHVQ01016366.1.p1  ORF type:complete len:296 (+),score=62.90 GHVQ01016366.1:151-1038(+)
MTSSLVEEVLASHHAKELQQQQTLSHSSSLPQLPSQPHMYRPSCKTDYSRRQHQKRLPSSECARTLHVPSPSTTSSFKTASVTANPKRSLSSSPLQRHNPSKSCSVTLPSCGPLPGECFPCRDHKSWSTASLYNHIPVSSFDESLFACPTSSSSTSSLATLDMIQQQQLLQLQQQQQQTETSGNFHNRSIQYLREQRRVRKTEELLLDVTVQKSRRELDYMALQKMAEANVWCTQLQCDTSYRPETDSHKMLVCHLYKRGVFVKQISTQVKKEHNNTTTLQQHNSTTVHNNTLQH